MNKKRFDISDTGEMTCNNQPISSKEAVMLLNMADDSIYSLYTVINYCIANEINLGDYKDNDELFSELEKNGVF